VFNYGFLVRPAGLDAVGECFHKHVAHVHTWFCR
jgi:hypothetical protein